MRSLILTLTLTLPACAKDNPGFSVGMSSGASDSGGATSDGATSGGSDDDGTTHAPTTTSDPDPTQAATSDSTVSPTTDTTLGASDTTIGDSSSTGEPACQPPVENDALDVRVLLNGKPVEQCDPQVPGYFTGVLAFDGKTLILKSTFECKDGDIGNVLVLGSGFAVDPFDGPSPCVKALVEWDPASAECKLGLLEIRLTADPAPLVYIGAFTVEPDENFPLQPKSENVTLCGCLDGGVGCCTDPDAGELRLIPDGGEPVAQYQKGPASSANGLQWVFYNQQSWMGPECDDGGGRHIDWLARAVP